ncbi:hypothetical protein V8E51_018929 [Hyaloscypha variabilis]
MKIGRLVLVSWTSHPPSCPWIRAPALSRLLRALQACSRRVDGVIPGVLADAAGADWAGLEFLLLRDSRHAIACAEAGLDWSKGEEGSVSRSMDCPAWQALLGHLIWHKRASAAPWHGGKSSEAQSPHGCLTSACLTCRARRGRHWLLAAAEWVKEREEKSGRSCGQAATHVEVPDEMYVALAFFLNQPLRAPPKFWTPVEHSAHDDHWMRHNKPPGPPRNNLSAASRTRSITGLSRYADDGCCPSD